MSSTALANTGGLRAVDSSLPYNLEAEQGILGALMIDNKALEKVGDFLKGQHFYAGVHQRIFEAIIKLVDRGQAATPITLKSYFEKDPALEEAGGAAYLGDLAANTLAIVNAEFYARTIYDLFMRRQLMSLGQEVISEAATHNVDEEATEIVERAEAKLFALAESGELSNGFKSLRESVLTAVELADKAFNTKGHVTGVTTGLKDIDNKMGGLQKSDLIILAGRPSMGKTALATSMAFKAAKAYADTNGKEGAITAFFSLEMSHDQLTTRILADLSSISSDNIRRGQISEMEFKHFARAANELSNVPLYIDDTAALSISAIRTRCRRLKRQHGLGMIVVDYLQLLRGSGTRQSEQNRVLEISEITRGLKGLAKELQVPVLALSQLSRAVEQREDKRPMLSDLRESGSIEQDADVVMFVYREEYYLERLQPDAEGKPDDFVKWQEKMDRVHNVAEAIIAKQRHGPIGTVKMFFNPHFTRFADLDQRN
ncbi:MAG: replicative DNA helicase [Alphaproteobacteria bacterium]|nr:replicative DNA helicase [Alphaproteobacteria bacterium]